MADKKKGKDKKGDPMYGGGMKIRKPTKKEKANKAKAKRKKGK
jgi:hypothetical protein